MNEIFEVRNEHPYNLRQNYQFFRPLVRSVYHGTESISYLGPKVWDILPNIYKTIDGRHKFKKAIKNGNLRIALVEFVRSTLQMLVLYKKQCLNFWLNIDYFE